MIPCSDTAERAIQIEKNSKKSNSNSDADENKIEASGSMNFKSGDRRMYTTGRVHQTESLGIQWHLLVCFGKYSNTAAFGYIL